MKKFKVYSTWREYAYQEVEANTKEEAEEIAEENFDNFEVNMKNDDGDWHIATELTEEI